MTNGIILAAGDINLTLLPITSSNSTALIPVNGKPVISHILDNLISRGIKNISVVIRKGDYQLDEFLKSMYRSNSIVIKSVSIVSKSIIYSLYEGLNSMDKFDKTLVVLGDTLIKDKIKLSNFNFACTSEVNDNSRWCTVQYDSRNIIRNYYDKIEDNRFQSKIALTGYYYFTDTENLINSTKSALKLNKKQLSEVLSIYGVKNPIRSITVKQWFDFGNIDNLIRAKRNLTQSRYFNSVEVNSSTATITKISNNVDKLTDEKRWYLSLPNDLQPFTPRLYSSDSKILDNKSITLEYYGYPTLAELYLYSNLNIDAWGVILSRIFEVHKIFIKHKGKCTRKDIETVYLRKTFNRISEIKKTNNTLLKMLSYNEIYINDNHYLGYQSLIPKIQKYVSTMKTKDIGRVIHGDFCFSNILFDYNNQIVKLIDPRGSFGEKNIYGDPRYDIAKLRHSIHGNYDHIMNNMYQIANHRNIIRHTIYTNKIHKKVIKILDEKILSLGYNIKDIKVIEGLLFLSMIPLHAEDKKRQIMFFAQGLSILNEVLK